MQLQRTAVTSAREAPAETLAQWLSINMERTGLTRLSKMMLCRPGQESRRRTMEVRVEFKVGFWLTCCVIPEKLPNLSGLQSLYL